MSFILDALRRAEAERDRARGQLPGLHTPRIEAVTAGQHRPPMQRLLPWATVGGLVVAAVGLGMWLQHQDPPPAATVQAPSVTPWSAVPSAPEVMPPRSPAVIQRQTEPARVTSANEIPHRSWPTRPAAPTASPQRPAPVAAPAVPKLNIGGSVYSEDPASRFLIVNGDVVHEGGQVAPGCTLERINPHDIVLNCRGERHQQAL
jgi:general secretion pathway protein B